MYGGPGKPGRGGGRGSGGQMKRNIHSSFNSSHLHRPVGGGGRLSGPRNTTSTTTAPPPKGGSSAEESFSLVTGNPLNFGMIIRLTPDLVDEIKKAESKGTTPRIRFDANAHNTTGNVIDVGGKDFRFTWSREMGDLCDIYEERQSGEDGNGLLVESGCAWRKLNVQRELDESTKNHVKMRSEEAERKLKSRKAIKLDDHGNPSMKSQMKALAAAEVNQWKMPFKQKKESQPPFKKRKAEPPPVPPKSVHKSGFPSITPSKGRPSASPLRFTPEQSGAPASPFGTMKTHAHVEDVGRTQPPSKGITTVPEKEIPRVITGAVRDKPGHKSNGGTQPTDLRSLLISLLRENPKGMSLKALEKAVDTIPNSVKKIEPIIKKIASFQAPGRYFLKPGVELESFKKPSSESGSSPEDNRHQTPALDDNTDQIPVSGPIFSAEVHRKESDEGAQLNSKSGDVSNAVENIDILFESPDLLGEKKNANNNEGPAGSSSDSGSDSDNDSSDSGSDSGSHSRSRSRSKSKSKSPAGSGSGSSSRSDSESDDASSNSREASDEDVDIMTSDDEKEPNPTLPIQWQTPNGDGPVINGIDENQDGHGSDLIEIEKDDQEAETNKEGEKPVEETKPFSPDRHEHQESLFYTPNLCSEKENMAKDGSEIKSKGKSKRVSDEKQFDDNPERAKRLKSENVTQQQMSGGRISRFSRFSASPHSLSPRPIDGPHKGPTTDFGLPKGYNQTILGKSTFVSQPPGRRSIDLSVLPKPPAVVEKPVKYDDFPMQKDKTQGEDGYYTNEQTLPKISKEGGVGDKQLTPVDSHYRKHGELVGKFKEVGSVSNSHTNYSPKDNYRIAIDKSPVINGRGSNSILRREPSDLELGELRESAPNETTIAVKKQFERKGPVKQLENKPSSSDYWNLDSNKGKASGKINADTIKRTPPNSSIGVRSNLEGLSKKRTPEHNVEELARTNHRIIPPQPQNVLRVDHAEAGSHFNKSADINNKSQAIGTTRGTVSHSTKESKKQKSNTSVDLREKQNDFSVTDRDNGRQKKGESSSDEISSSYIKYEKEEAELKGPIKDIYQYEEYVHEYREKYDVYISVNKVLESYRDEFNKYKEEFEMAKGKDVARCHKIGEQIKEAYRECKTKHCRLKNIFVVLHEELKRLKEMIKEFANSVDKD